MSALPPGPAWPRAVQTVAWGLRPQQFFAACRRRFGDTFTIRFYDGRQLVVVSRPDDVRAVFGLRAGEFGVTDPEILEPFLGPSSVLVLDGDDHRAERRRLQHAFHAERLERYRALVAEATHRSVRGWPVGAPFPLHEQFRAITLDVILEAVFGGEGHDRHRLRAALADFLADGSDSVFVLIPLFRRELGGRSPWARFVRQRDAVHREMRALIRRRRAQPSDGVDVLSALLDAGPVTDEQVLDELMTLVLAGHDTTATALAWTFDLLVHHPVVMTRLCDDLARGSDDYLDAVIQESLRIRPVIGEVTRRLRHPLRVGWGELPSGTSVMASIYLAHTDPAAHADAEAFVPERFLGRTPDLATWLPFGGGLRRCLGAGFALLELREVVRTVVTSVRLHAAGRPERPRRRAVTLMPRRGCRVVAEEILDRPVGVGGPGTMNGRGSATG
jgi:cytochrome P450